MVQPLWETMWQFLRELNIHFTYDPAIPLLHIYLPERRDKYVSIQRLVC